MEQEGIKQRKDQILTDSLLRLDDLLTKAENLQLDNPLDKWLIHHALLEEIPLLEKLFILCEYDGREQIINRVKKITENLAPVTNLECYR